MTFIAANMGAKKKDNIKKCILYGFIWGSIFCSVIALAVLLFHYQMLSLFVTDRESLEAGYVRLGIMETFINVEIGKIDDKTQSSNS